MKKENPAGLMTLSDYARHRQCHRSHVSRLAAAGVLIMRTTPAGRKLVDVARSDAILDDVPVDVAEEETTPATAGRQPRTTFAEARTVFMVYSAKLARLSFEEKERKLIAAEDVRQRISEHLAAIRIGLDALADRLTPLLAGERDAKRVRAIMTTEIRTELVRIAAIVGRGANAGGQPEV